MRLLRTRQPRLITVPDVVITQVQRGELTDDGDGAAANSAAAMGLTTQGEVLDVDELMRELGASV